MLPAVAILALLAASPPSGEGLLEAGASPLLHLALTPWAPVRSARDGGWTPPACSGDVCQPRVAVPGYEPRVSMRGRRTDLVLSLLDRARIEPLASVVWALAASGLRFDYTPATFDTGGLSYGHGGWGHVELFVRWRLDAANAPVWPVRHR